MSKEPAYVILLNLDTVGAARVRQIQKRLEKAGLGPAMSDAIPPHVTLAAFGQIEPDATIGALAAFFDERTPQPLQFDILATFPETGVLHAAPLVTAGLLALHADLHAALAPTTRNPYAYYRPDAWHPHCTVIEHLSREALSEAFRLALEMWEPFSAAAAEVALVRPGGEKERLFTQPLG